MINLHFAANVAFTAPLSKSSWKEYCVNVLVTIKVWGQGSTKHLQSKLCAKTCASAVPVLLFSPRHCHRDIRQCRRRYCAFGLAKMSLFFKLWQEPFQSRPHWRLPQTSFRAKEWRAGVFDGKQWEQKANRQNIAGYWFLVCHSPIFTMLPSEGFSTLEFHK